MTWASEFRSAIVIVRSVAHELLHGNGQKKRVVFEHRHSPGFAYERRGKKNQAVERDHRNHEQLD